MDFHRMVWGLTYYIDDAITLHTEVDFEHSASEMELEFAHLDFNVSPGFNLRAGSMLMPVGMLNEIHEPPLFYSVERPYVETYMIPSTWNEGGFGAFGVLADGELKYRLYLVSGLNAEGFKADSGIRKGRGKVKSESDDLAAVGRLEYIGLPGLAFGVSLYQGGANAGKNPDLGSPAVTLMEADARLRKAGFDLRGSIVSITLSDADKVSTVTGESIGEKMSGMYIEGAYNLLNLFHAQSHALMAFARYENFNTQAEVADGFTADKANDRTVTTAGLAYYPHPDVAIKFDMENWKDGADTTGSRINTGMAYQF
jgi:hypothetical protein